MMKRLARTLSTLSALLSGLTLIQMPRKWAALAGILVGPKSLAGALSPFLAIMGGAGALLGLASRDRRAFQTGLFGAIVAARHVAKTKAPHDAFEQAFGPGWRVRIPAHIERRMLQRRWQMPMPEPPEAPRWQRDVTFGVWPETGEPLLCDIWEPPDGVKRSGLAVIYLHGSGWHVLDKDFGTRTVFRHLAGQGHVIMDVAYTLGPKADMFGMVGDVKRAIAWMKEHTDRYGVNPERIVLMGGSAGGHLALLSAYTPNHPALQPEGMETDTSVRAVVSYYGITDVRAAHRYWQPDGVIGAKAGLGSFYRLFERMEPKMRERRILPPYGRWVAPEDWMPGLLGGTPEEVPERYALASPICHVGPECPPTLIVQGAHDFGGMLPQARELHRALKEAGATSVYVEFPDTEHAFDLYFPKWNPAAQAATYDVERFLALMV